MSMKTPLSVEKSAKYGAHATSEVAEFVVRLPFEAIPPTSALSLGLLLTCPILNGGIGRLRSLPFFWGLTTTRVPGAHAVWN